MILASQSNPLGPLNPGNVVSAALRLYRDRFKLYFGLAVRAYLWLLVPVYGWAKYFAIAAMISRLAFQDVISQPETLREAERQLQPKLWSFLGLGFLILLVAFAAYFGLLLAAAIPGVALGFLASGIFRPIFGADVAAGIGAVVGVLVGLAIFLVGIIYLVARLLIAEVPLAIEPNLIASASIGRSWSLSKDSVLRIQFVVVAAFLINLPILIVTSYLPQLLLLGVEFGSSAYWTLYVFTLVLSFLGGMVVMPFWQAVKGVLYYDLRSRREGLDLQLPPTDA